MVIIELLYALIQLPMQNTIKVILHSSTLLLYKVTVIKQLIIRLAGHMHVLAKPRILLGKIKPKAVLYLTYS